MDGMDFQQRRRGRGTAAGPRRPRPWPDGGALLIAVFVSLAVALAASGCGTEEGSGAAPTPTAAPTAVESPVPVTTSEPTPSPTAESSATADPSDVGPDGTYEDRARYWVEQEEAWREKAVAAVSATDHPGGDIWEAMQEPMVIPEDEMPDDPDAPAWRDLAVLAREYAEWWERVVDDPSLPFSQQ